MKNSTNANETILCPSAREGIKDSKVFGLVGGTVEKPRVTYLKSSQSLTDELIALSSPVTPTEVFRIASPCVEKGCQHFDGKNCGLAMAIVDKMSEVTQELPPCSIRRDCRWWKQEGKAACLRCPQIITDNYNPTELIRELGKPAVS